MKKMQIFEGAMCCSTGLCGIGVDPELLRISTVFNSLKKSGVEVKRFNLSESPQEFVDNKVVNKFINEKGIEEFPLTVLDGVIVKTKKYPTNEELVKLLDVPMSFLGEVRKTYKIKGVPKAISKSNDCGCGKGGCC